MAAAKMQRPEKIGKTKIAKKSHFQHGNAG